MQTIWIPTDAYYRQIIAAPDLDARQRLYEARFIQPWQTMMDMIGPMFNADPADPLAVARAWHWLLPEDLDREPAALSRLQAANAWETAATALAAGTARFAPYADRFSIDTVEGWLILADPERSDPIGRGYTGAVDWTQPRLVAQFDTPNDDNLSRLPGLVAHELHHILRLHLFPWGMQTSVADYIIHEGMAESFAAALYGEQVVGHYVTDVDDMALETAKRLIGDSLDKTGFHLIRAYIFGDYWAEQYHLPQVGMPVYGGYAIGYHVVQAYLRATGSTVEEATCVPANTIVHDSGFFE